MCTHNINRYVKLTSPLINVIMCIGAILLYVEMVIIGIEKNLIIMTAMCNVSFLYCSCMWCTIYYISNVFIFIHKQMDVYIYVN